MKKIGMFWGSSSDNTKTAAEFMEEYLEMNDVEIESFDIAEIDLTVPKDAVTLSGINTETRDNERSLIKT